MLSMKKGISEFLYIFLLLFSIFPFDRNDFSELGIKGEPLVPKTTAYELSEDMVRITYMSHTIFVDMQDDFAQYIHVYKGEKLIRKERLPQTISDRHLCGVYELSLIKGKSPYLLISSYIVGASGVSASITHAILIHFDKTGCAIQYISTYGCVEDNFIDIDNDSVYEFVCVDCITSSYQYGQIIYAPNIFSITDGNYKKNLFDVNTTMCCSVDGSETCYKTALEWNVKALVSPNIITKVKYRYEK